MVKDAVYDCSFSLREFPCRRKDVVRIGCGAGFAGDRPSAALKLLRRVPNMDYLVLECLAERTLTERVQAKAAGGKGYDPRISDWMAMLLPVAVEKRVCIITNMGGVDPLGARDEVCSLSSELGMNISVAIAYEHPLSADGSSTYLGAGPLVTVLEQGKPHVIITSRLADASLFLGPMVYELGWNWNDFTQIAQGTLAGHLLECGCQLTGGYYMHPGDEFRNISINDISLPYADVYSDGKVVLAKAEGSGGELSVATCTQQLLYEVGDPSSYITPDVILDLEGVKFTQLSKDKVLATGAQAHPNHLPELLLRLVPSFCGWKGWGEISYGGLCCEERARISDQLVRSWMEEAYPGVGERILSYIIGKDSLFVKPGVSTSCQEVRLRLDGQFESQEQASRLVAEFGALYTNGPAGGGGISWGWKKEIVLNKEMVRRDQVFWKVSTVGHPISGGVEHTYANDYALNSVNSAGLTQPAPAGVELKLYQVAHSRTGDKGNTLNVVTGEWMKNVMGTGLGYAGDKIEVCVYLVRGVCALNIVVKGVLDGGVTCSRRIDRHGKTLSDLILSQHVCLPPRAIL